MIVMIIIMIVMKVMMFLISQYKIEKLIDIIILSMMSIFTSFSNTTTIPPPSDEQLNDLYNTIHAAVYSDPCVTYESMILKGYRVITPMERYYYEEQIKHGNVHVLSPYLLKNSLWVLEGSYISIILLLYHINTYIRSPKV